MIDGPEEIRRLIDGVDPVTAAEARDRAVADPSPIGPAQVARDRAPVFALVGVAVVAVFVVVVFAMRSPGSPSVETNQEGTTIPTTIARPPGTVLPPVGVDPVVSCDFFSPYWFRPSAWDGPPNPRLDLPAADVLRNLYVLNDMAKTSGVPTPFPDVPIESWRLLSADDSHVLWGIGDFDRERVVSDELGPVLIYAQADYVDGVWQYGGAGGGGTCNELYVQPPDGASPSMWGPAELPGPESTSITINVASAALCGAPLRADELLGPDVVETTDTVSIRAAINRPTQTNEQLVDCHIGDDPPPESPSVTVTVPLSAPLGDRQLLDANQFPARPIDLDAMREREKGQPSTSPP